MPDNIPPKVVVFDLDETLGYFTEFGVFYDLLIKHLQVAPPLRSHVFRSTIDLFPEVLRPNIMSVLNYLKRKKQSGVCNKVLIYTNNQGPPEWRNMIKDYLHDKLEYVLFDKVIGAFKLNGRVTEVSRTTSDKTTDDLIRCARLPGNTQICFIDDVHYENMDNVYYIKVNPYIHNISMNIMVNRLLTSPLCGRFRIVPSRYVSYVREKIHGYKYTYKTKDISEYEIDKIVTKKLMLLLQDFFE